MLARMQKPTYRLTLDEIGSFVWERCDGTLIRIRPRAKKIPTMTSGHAISPPTIPFAINAISPACGAGNYALPIT